MKKSSQAAHRPSRRFPNADRAVFQPEIKKCPYCQCKLKSTGNISINREVQTMDGPLNIRAYSWCCSSQNCPRPDVRYRARRQLWKVSLPKFGYGLDVVAHIGWQRDQRYRQFSEIQTDLHTRDIIISERHVGRLYRQYLSLLGGLDQQRLQKLKEVNRIHGGVVWALDALQPDQDSTQLYVLYEAISETTVAAAWLDKRDSNHLIGWLRPYTDLQLTVLATLSDGEDAEIKALKTLWPDSPHQMCLTHFLGDCIKPIKKADRELKATLRQAMGPLPPIPGDQNSAKAGPLAASPLLVEQEQTPEDQFERIKEDESTHRDNLSPNYKSDLPACDDTTVDPQGGSSSDNHNAQPQAPNTQLADCQADSACAEDDLQASSSPQWPPSANSASFFPVADICKNNPAQAEDRDLSTTIYRIGFRGLSDPDHRQPEGELLDLASALKPRIHQTLGVTEADQVSDKAFFEQASTGCTSSSLVDQITYSFDCDLFDQSLILTDPDSSATASKQELDLSLPKNGRQLENVSNDACTKDDRRSEKIAPESEINQEQLRKREIEILFRKSFQKSLRHPSRYPSAFGGLAGYSQLEGLIRGMREQLFGTPESYLHRLLRQGEEALKSGSQQASNLREADELRSELTRVLFSRNKADEVSLLSQEKSGEQIKQEVLDLLSLSESNCGDLTKEFIATSRSLISKWEESLFNCYDVPLLPANNAALESRFNCLRRATRRISGRKKTNELRRTAHLQLLLYAESKEELLEQFGLVEEEAYLKARLSLEAAEEPLRQLARLSRKPYETASLLAAEYIKLI